LVQPERRDDGIQLKPPTQSRTVRGNLVVPCCRCSFFPIPCLFFIISIPPEIEIAERGCLSLPDSPLYFHFPHLLPFRTTSVLSQPYYIPAPKKRNKKKKACWTLLGRQLPSIIHLFQPPRYVSGSKEAPSCGCFCL
jgi:hypothetical protein